MVGVIIVQEIVLGVEFNDDVLTGGRFLRDIKAGDTGICGGWSEGIETILLLKIGVGQFALVKIG